MFVILLLVNQITNVMKCSISWKYLCLYVVDQSFQVKNLHYSSFQFCYPKLASDCIFMILYSIGKYSTVHGQPTLISCYCYYSRCLPSIKSTHWRLYQDTVMKILRNTLSPTNHSISLVQGVVLLSESMDHLLIIDIPSRDQLAGESCTVNNMMMELNFLMSKAMLQGLKLLWEKSLK